MSKLVTIVSATIVLIFTGTPAGASPQRQMPDALASDPAESPQADPLPENMSISPAPPVVGRPQTHQARYFNYEQALTFRAGLAGDLEAHQAWEPVIGFQYLFPKFLSPKLEAGADLHKNGRGHIHAGARWIYFERSYFRPSLKAALDHYVDAEKGLGTLVRKEDWFARAGAALEQVVWDPYSLRLEAEVLANLDQQWLMVSVGLSHAW